MHDCVRTKERLVDLVFDELEPEARRGALIEIEGCQDCLAEYRSMTETLRVFDQAAEMTMPDESYWPGYEAGLRVRLREERLSLKRRLADWIGGFGLFTAMPVRLAAGFALILLAAGWWGWRQWRAAHPSPHVPNIASVTPTPQSTPQPEVELRDDVIAVTTKPDAISDRRKPAHPKTEKPSGRAPSVRREERGGRIVEDVVVSTRGYDQPLIAASLFTPETIKHFEKAQLMLRSFRNASGEKAAEGLKPVDLAYEKQLSRRLLYQNILLRRDAEMKGNLPAEEALSSLEPFLLDIANLPDEPSPGDLNGIKERLQRKELIASLQISSARPSAPIYQNP